VRLPTQKKVLREDVKGAPSWINPLIDTLNSFMETVYQALNKNVTFGENIGCVIKELSYTTVSTYPAGQPVTEFTTGLKTKATGLWVMQVYEKAIYAPPPGPVWAPWVENNGNIELGTVTGLEASKTYLVRFLVS
jgi:hypothetical protein